MSKPTAREETLVWAMNQASEQGISVEWMAQNIVSLCLSAGSEDGQTIWDVTSRLFDLCQHYNANPDEIWDGLLPGPPTPAPMPEPIAKIIETLRDQAITGKDIKPDGYVLGSIINYLRDQGWDPHEGTVTANPSPALSVTALVVTVTNESNRWIVQIIDGGTKNEAPDAWIGQLALWDGNVFINLGPENEDGLRVEIGPGFTIKVDPQDVRILDPDATAMLLRDE
jgi:hypothetical protein